MSDLESYSVPLLLDILVRAVNDDLDAALAASRYSDITRAQGNVFSTIDPDGSHVVEMAERARMTKQGMGQLVAALEAGGYVTRTADPEDARAKLVVLTAKGERAAGVGVGAFAAIDDKYRQLLGHGRFEELRRTLAELAEAFATDHIR
jgi:DNA-binding MarR family transcriptional regulator